MASKVRELREEKGLTQSELGDLVGVSRQTIYYLEKGNYNPKLTLSLKLSKVLGASIRELFYFEPIIKDIINSLAVQEMDDVEGNTNLTREDILSLRNLSDEELNNKFDKADLKDLTAALGKDFTDLFEIENE